MVVFERLAGEPTDVDGMKDRVLLTPSARFATARIEPIETWQQHWRGWLSSLGIHYPSLIDMYGDGADWIWNVATVQYLGGRQMLDAFHACEHLADAAKVIYLKL